MKGNNKCDIFLTTTPPWDPYSPSAGLGYLASSLTNAGIKCIVRELNNYLYYHSLKEDQFLWQFEYSNLWNNHEFYEWIFPKLNHLIDRFVDEILDMNPVICGISVAFTKELCTMELIKKLKFRQPDIKIILGGPGVTCEGSRKYYINNIPELIDAYVIGEGEQSLVELYKAIVNNQGPESVKGILTYRNNTYTNLVTRPFIRPLDQLTFPTYNEFIIDGPFEIALPVFSRGCISNCVFCNVRAMWGTFRIRSPKNIFEEIRFLVEEKNINQYIIYDSAINCHLKVLSTFCDLIIKAGYKLSWKALAIPRDDMPIELFIKMKKAGCKSLEIGVESGADKIIKMMGKKFTSENAKNFIRKVHSSGIKVVLFIIVGFPGETEEDFEETCNFIKENHEYIDIISSINTFMALDDTEVRLNPQKYGIKFPVERRELYWYDDGGNNYDARIHRVNILRQIVQDYNIQLIKDNII